LKLDYLKALSVEAAQQLSYIPSEDAHAFRQSKCATYLRYAIEKDTWHTYLNKAYFCKQRTCPVCSWLRSVKWRIRIFRGLPRLLLDFPAFSFLFLTLTVRNCHFSELRSCVGSMQQSWKRLADLSSFPAVGYLKSLEVARPRDCFWSGHYLGRYGSKQTRVFRQELKQRGFSLGSWSEYFCEEVHPHFHVLMMVRPDYWTSGYLDHSQWVSLWRRAARLEYDPVVDIRWVKSDQLNSGVLEVSKYCLKSSDMTDRLGCLINRRLHGLKLLYSGGVFADYFSQKALDRVDESLTLGDEYEQDGVPLVYEWNGSAYSMTQLAHLFWKL